MLTLSHLNCYSEASGNVTRINELDLFVEPDFTFIVKEDYHNFGGIMSTCKAGLHTTLLYYKHIKLRCHDYAINVTMVPCSGKIRLRFVLFYEFVDVQVRIEGLQAVLSNQGN